MTDPHVTTASPVRPADAARVPEEALAAAVTGCRDVARLSGGPFGEVATYLAGRRIEGVRLLEDRIEVHVVARWGRPLPALAEDVRSACAPFAGGRRVDVTIDDVVDVPLARVPTVGTPGPRSVPIAPSTPPITPGS